MAAFVTVAFAFCAISSYAQSFGRSELIKAAQYLEENPFSKDAKGIRAFAVKYVIETDEVSVVVCGGELTSPLLDKKNKNSTELIGQYTIGMAAFKLQNPSNKNENDAQLAGIESTLRAYEKMTAEKPKTKHDGMDGLLAKRNASELKGLVDQADCGKK